jgi:hypothetical protein
MIEIKARCSCRHRCARLHGPSRAVAEEETYSKPAMDPYSKPAMDPCSSGVKICARESPMGPSRNKRIFWHGARSPVVIPAKAGMTTEGVALPSIDAVVSSQVYGRASPHHGLFEAPDCRLPQQRRGADGQQSRQRDLQRDWFGMEAIHSAARPPNPHASPARSFPWT